RRRLRRSSARALLRRGGFLERSRRDLQAVSTLVAVAALSGLLALQAHHPLHLRDRKLVNGIIAVSLAEGVIGADVVVLLGERASLLHVRLRGIGDCALVMLLVLDVLGIGSECMRKLMRCNLL